MEIIVPLSCKYFNAERMNFVITDFIEEIPLTSHNFFQIRPNRAPRDHLFGLC